MSLFSTTILHPLVDTPLFSIVTTTTESDLPYQCSNYKSITDGTRRTTNKHGDAESDHTFFKTPAWVRFEGDAGTRLANYSVPHGRCGSEGSGWVKYPTDPEVGETVTQTACFNWNGNSCIWPKKISVTNCGGFLVYALVAPSLSDARYCTI